MGLADIAHGRKTLLNMRTITCHPGIHPCRLTKAVKIMDPVFKDTLSNY